MAKIPKTNARQLPKTETLQAGRGGQRVPGTCLQKVNRTDKSFNRQSKWKFGLGNILQRRCANGYSNKIMGQLLKISHKKIKSQKLFGTKMDDV